MKKRRKPRELIMYEYLLRRKSLSHEEMRKYRTLKKGYEGELLFDRYIESLPGDFIFLHDLWLSYRNRAFQIDHILIINNTLYLYEIKNFPGEYYYENEKLYFETGKEVDDPLTQLKRNESLLRQLLYSLGYQIPLQAVVVFVNPECTLYQAPRTSKILLPTQLKQYFQHLQTSTAIDPIFHKLEEKFESIRLEKSPYEQLPSYNYNDIKKGIPCKSCNNFLNRIEGKMIICAYCGEREHLQSSILRNIKEFIFLFPEQQITTERMYQWCNFPIRKQRMRYVLRKNLIQKGSNKRAYYILKK